ncbi:MAG: rRNA maturation RNAse YbeY [Candidatus Aegiribacteria sp.]|nr:rRNA maturation RNAse YbeY [Candidatus Aegiribacteria sp.]
MEINTILNNPAFKQDRIDSLIDGLLLDGNVEIVITDPGYIRVLNRKYRHIDRSTDVLSFDLATSEEERPDGIVYVDGRLFPPYEALLERIIHGYLHLMGYSHEEPDKSKIMNERVTYLVSSAMERLDLN